MNTMRLKKIHNSLVNGQRKQMVEQIDNYGLYDFWNDYAIFLNDHLLLQDQFLYFQDATISYFRIKNR